MLVPPNRRAYLMARRYETASLRAGIVRQWVKPLLETLVHQFGSWLFHFQTNMPVNAREDSPIALVLGIHMENLNRILDFCFRLDPAVAIVVIWE